MNKKLISILTIVILLISAITTYQYNKSTTKNITITVIESDGISDNPNEPLILTTLEDSNNIQYDLYTNQIETKGDKVLITLNNENEIIDYKVIE